MTSTEDADPEDVEAIRDQMFTGKIDRDIALTVEYQQDLPTRLERAVRQGDTETAIEIAREWATQAVGRAREITLRGQRLATEQSLGAVLGSVTANMAREAAEQTPTPIEGQNERASLESRGLGSTDEPVDPTGQADGEDEGGDRDVHDPMYS
jgi:hypothetical protein